MTDRELRRLRLVPATICLGIASYLTAVHYSGGQPACTSGGCETVQHSVYACVGSAVMMTFLVALSYNRFWRQIEPPRERAGG